MPFQPCTYIMTNKPRGLPYIGVTSDLLKRIYQHREGIADGFTKRYNLDKLVLFEQFGTMSGQSAAIPRHPEPNLGHPELVSGPLEDCALWDEVLKQVQDDD